RAVIAAREEGPFESIWDFTERVDPSIANKRVVEALVKCGAIPGPRKGSLEVLEQALSWGQKQQADRLAGQGSIFDLGPPDDARPRPDREGARRPQGRRDEADRDGRRGLRGGGRQARGAAQDRRDEGAAGHDPRARAVDPRLPGREPRFRRLPDVAGPARVRL